MRRSRAATATSGRTRRSFRTASDSLADRLLATILHQRLALPQVAVAALLNVRPETINRRIRDIRQLLDQAGYAVQPAPQQLASLGDLHRLAATAGIVIPSEIKAAC
jgi:hypothetical protein